MHTHIHTYMHTCMHAYITYIHTYLHAALGARYLLSEQPFCDGSHKGTEFAPMPWTAEEAGTKFASPHPTHTHTHSYTYTHVYVCMHACMHACMYVCMMMLNLSFLSIELQI